MLGNQFLLNSETGQNTLYSSIFYTEPHSGKPRPKPEIATKKTPTIYHILITCFVNNFFKTATFTNDISGHFPICGLFPLHEIPNVKEATCLYKKILNTESIDKFKHGLFEVMDDIESNLHPIEALLVIFTKNQFSLRREFSNQKNKSEKQRFVEFSNYQCH